MSDPVERPYGTWPSPLAAEDLVAGAAAVGEVRVDGDDVWWTESRPSEGGRIELVRRRVDGTTSDLLADRPPPTDGGAWNARTRCYEYGGGAWCVESGVVVFAHWADQRLYRVVADDPGAVPVPLTPVPASAGGVRFGDVVALDHGWVLAVRERHPGEDGVPTDASEPVHDIVAVPTDGSAVEDPSAVRVLAGGGDFVASPVPGPARLAWIRWDHPRMPWDGTELCVTRLGRDAAGAPEVRGEPTTVAGGPDESVVQPEWDRDGDLWFSSDRSGWWNVHRTATTDLDGSGTGGGDSGGRAVAVAPVEAEIGGPRWVGGMRWYAPLADGRVLASSTAGGATGVVLVDPSEPSLPPRPVPIDLGGAPVSVVSQVVAGPGPSQAVVVAASGRAEAAPILVDLPAPDSAPASDGGRGRRALPDLPPRSEAHGERFGSLPAPEGRAQDPDTVSRRTESASVPSPRQNGTGPVAVATLVLRPGRDVGLTTGDVSVPESISFPSSGGRTAHAQLYLPASSTSVGPPDELPPLVVMIHGGPTSAARPMLDLRTQYWTTRGFAVVDVDYGGSTGYGRPYRRLLDGAWGIVDVEDCAAAARHLADEGIVDGSRTVIRGGSAGGFTTLAALCAGDGFAAGTSLYGVADLGALARDTHKFEARYLDGLVGPWPDDEATYVARSPLDNLDRLATPLLVLQGSDDAVVPPNQAEMVVEAVAAKGLPHAYVLFEGEGHGFRRSEVIVTALETELAFYGEILGFAPDDDLPPLPATVRPT